MSEEKVHLSREEVMLKNVRFFSGCQSTPENRENYFRSCEAHGDEMKAVVAKVRTEGPWIGSEIKFNPEIGLPDEYWMNSVERVISLYPKPTSEGLIGLAILIGVNYHWPSIKKGHKTSDFGYDSFDPMI